MGFLILVIFYGSILFCIVASTVKILHYISAPLHLHWELYRKGSVYESVDWGKQPPPGFLEKIPPMLSDILLLKGYYQRDRGLWFFLFLFHLGIYLLILWHLWLFAGSVTLDIGKASDLGRVWGHFSTVLASIGGAGVLLKRATQENAHAYYPPIHYLKWVLILITLAEAFYAVDVYFAGKMPVLFNYVRDQVTFQDFERKLHPGFAPAAHVLLASVWLIYLPFSHMMKLFSRYYHHLRWDGVPNQKGSPIESRVKALLKRPVSWSASHIQSDQSWKEVVSETGTGMKTGN